MEFIERKLAPEERMLHQQIVILIEHQSREAGSPLTLPLFHSLLLQSMRLMLDIAPFRVGGLCQV